MPKAQEDVLKTALLALITRHIGQKTADLYRAYYDSQSQRSAIASAENLLAEFIGREMAKNEVTAACTAAHVVLGL